MTDREELPVEVLVWRGVTIHIRRQDKYSGMRNLHHLDIEAVSPERAKLPITETGYRSHFYYGEAVADAVVAVHQWLEDEAKGQDWQAHVQTSQQLNLFG